MSTQPSRAAADQQATRQRLPRWVPVIGAAALAGFALIVYLAASKSPRADADAGRVAAGGSASRLPIAAVDQHGGGSMQGAVAGLERRLATKGGSDADWELLARSYEFLGRASDAALARGKHLPAGAGLVEANSAAAPAGAAAPADDKVSVDGEVILADALRDKVPAGLTLFIVAKSVNSPGPPVAILRTTTDVWPVRFRLDDTQAILPQRKLSTAGLVTLEARTSKSGQAMPERGDFQGVTLQLDPAAGKPVRIVIERVIS